MQMGTWPVYEVDGIRQRRKLATMHRILAMAERENAAADCAQPMHYAALCTELDGRGHLVRQHQRHGDRRHPGIPGHGAGAPTNSESAVTTSLLDWTGVTRRFPIDNRVGGHAQRLRCLVGDMRTERAER